MSGDRNFHISKDGNDANPFIFLMKCRNESGSPKILTCPGHQGTMPAITWEQLTPEHITCKFRASPDVDETIPASVIQATKASSGMRSRIQNDT